MPISAKTKKLYEKWLSFDTNEASREEITALYEAGDEDELFARVGNQIAFGTAGLRGKMAAGFSCMNTVTVAQATQGLQVYLAETLGDAELQKRGVVIGYDGRHHSLEFARLATAILVSQSVPVYLYNRIVATPLVPFGVLHHKAAAGVMVTASHNPKDDNGYKVYWSNGCQIISPIDKGIAQAIAANEKPWPLDVDTVLSDSGTLVRDVTDATADAYFAKISSLCHHHEQNAATDDFPIVFTAMHGVGKEWVRRAFETFGLRPYVPVAEQIEADPDFPTVAFPNPEEGKGALALAFETAARANSSLVLANDPDSDRLAVAELQADGEWRVFSGNEIGILLANWVWQKHKEANPQCDAAKVLVLNTTVSSKMLKALADKEGLRYEETLTGFKWLGNVGLRVAAEENCTFLFAYEEAIGFLIGDACYDKDGVRAAAVFAEMAIDLRKRHQRSIAAQFTHLQELYGYFVANNGYFFCHEPEVMKSIFDEMRPKEGGGDYPKKCGRFNITHVRDLTTGYDSEKADKKATLPVSASSQMITFKFENGAVVTLRGSGTEPKLKYYMELSGSSEESARKELEELANAVIEELLAPDRNGLQRPKVVKDDEEPPAKKARKQ